MKFIFTLSLLMFSFLSFSQTIATLTSKTGISLRGLSVLNDSVLWASGSKGTVVRSLNGGKTFDWMTVTGYEARDFRDVEAFDKNTAIIMAVDEPAVILKTFNGGKSWQKVFEDSTKGMFLDAMDFSGKFGVVVGDPVNGKMFIAYTKDKGEHWKVPDSNQSVSMFTGEAFFASSGTNVKLLKIEGEKPYLFCVSGGTKSRFLFDGKFDSIPMIQGKESTGANSIAVNASSKTIVVAGGDFANAKDTANNCFFSTGRYHKQWQRPQTPPHGYRSCVAFITNGKLIACGTSGIDISNDNGMNWTLLSNESFHACGKAKRGTTVYLAGKDGRIAKLGE